jgi:hypothetical protein
VLQQEETRLVKFRIPGTELPLELVDTPQPKKLFLNFRQKSKTIETDSRFI